MAELIIESVPSGAEVQMDGEVVGTTPLAITIDDGGLEAFRAECLLGGAVSCDWGTLYTRLIHHDVSTLWWDLTETERRSIAEMAIKNTFFYDTQFKRTGKSNCAGGEGAWYRTEHVTNSIIRYQKFAYGLSGTDSCYWATSIYAEENCFSLSDVYGLPCFMVSCTGINDPYSMCCVQVVQGTDSLDNWIVFQYPNFDMKSGDPLMPRGSTVKIQIPSSFIPCDGVVWDSTIATFVLEPSELERFREECLFGGAVICSWGTMKIRLEDQTVSRLWWDLTETERRSIAEMAIKNTMFKYISEKRKGSPNCAGGTEEWGTAVCTSNAMMRYLTFAKPMDGMDSCYWRYGPGDEEACYTVNNPYRLPCFLVSCMGISHVFGHAMVAIQVVPGVDSLDNWIVFQYTSFDIKPGNWQMPVESSVRIVQPISFLQCGAYTYEGFVADYEV